MAIASGNDTPESTTSKRYTGIAACSLLAINPNKEEDDKILEEERKMHISTDLDIEKNNNTEGGTDGVNKVFTFINEIDYIDDLWVDNVIYTNYSIN